MRRALIGMCVGTVLGCGAVCARAAAEAAVAPQTWELRDGRWEQQAAPAGVAATQPVSDALLDRVEVLLQRGQHRGAHDLLIAWLREHRTSPLRDRAIYLLGESWYQYGNRILAFY